MGKARAKPLPLVVKVVSREEQASLVQECAYRQLWNKLLAPEKEDAPAPGGESRGDGGNDASEPPSRE